jgi:hypothetical protein
MRRFPRLRVLVTGFALIGLTAVLAGTASGPAHATTTGAPVFNNLPPKSQTSCYAGQVQLQPCQVVLVPADTSDTAKFSTGITAHRYGFPNVLVPVTCKPLLLGDPQPPIGLNAAPVYLPTRVSPPPVGVPSTSWWGTYQYSCTATDGSQSTTVTVSLTAQDQPTNKPATPGSQNATADTSDTATVTYPAVTSSEGSVKNEVGEAVLSCGNSPLSNGATSDNQFVSGGTFPLGVTKLYCTAPDYTDGQPGRTPPSAILSVTVADQPATLTVPPLQLARATSSSGATVTYAPDPVMATEIGATATEADTPLCSTDKAASSADGFISGGTFPVGGTTVTCAAPVNDDPTNPGPYQAFTVIITNTPCATLAGCNLHGLDLSNAILAGADLSSGTDLSNANLNKADLSGANLSFANLSGANLNQADLTGANLTGVNLTGANLNKANLDKANLDGVTWSNTTCRDGTNSSASTPETCVGHL